MLILHRPFFADTTFSTPFYSSVMAKSVCLGAARETILLSHRKLVNVPSVEHWSCYYHRVLAATMLILAFGPESPLMDKSSFEDICSKGMEIFRCMSSGCPMKGIVLIENTLARMLDQSTTTNMNLGIAVSTE